MNDDKKQEGTVLSSLLKEIVEVLKPEVKGLEKSVNDFTDSLKAEQKRWEQKRTEDSEG